MHVDFLNLVEALEPKFLQLIEMRPLHYHALPRDLPKRAIYLFSEGSKHLYVGRTNNLRNRLRGHCAASSQHFSAVFAFRIARTQTGLIKPSYKRAGSRADLSEQPHFKAAFTAAKCRVAAMDIRFVQEVDAVRQALLEIYTATVLKTPFNDFENH